MLKPEKPTMITLRPTDEDFKLLEALRQRLGVGYSQIIRIAIRRFWKAESGR